MKWSIFAILFVFSLAMMSCVCACDVNETAIEDQFIEDTMLCEDEIADVSLSSTVDEENPVDDIIVDNNNCTTSFEIVDNNVEDECDFGIEKVETPIIGLMISKFGDEKILDATVLNDNISITSLTDLNVSFGDLYSFEVYCIKMEDFDSEVFKDEEFNNLFEIKEELLLSISYDAFSEVIVDCDIVVCSNKLNDEFAYSIDNSIIGDESNILYHSTFFVDQIFTNYIFNMYAPIFQCSHNFFLTDVFFSRRI